MYRSAKATQPLQNMTKITLIFILFAPFTAMAAIMNGLITAEQIASGTKSFTSAVAKYSMTKSESGLTIEIANSLSQRYLVNPKLYLTADGDTVSPPPLKIPSAANPKERVTRTIFFDKKPKGMLCYECPTAETILQGGGSPTTTLICLYFDAKEYTYGFAIAQDYHSNKKQFEEQNPNSQVTEAAYYEWLYRRYENKHIPLLISAKEYSEYVPLEDTYLNVLVICQMTTGKNGRLFFDIQDLKSGHARKREIISTSLVTGVVAAVPAIAMAAYNYIKAEQGTVLTLENLSTEKDPFVLEDPVWYGEGANVQDIIPWNLGPGKSNDITIIAPFAAGETLKHSVFLLSFRVKAFRDRVVLAVWWPRKLDPTEKINSYALAWFRPDKTALEKPQIRGELRNIANAIIENPYDVLKANEKLAVSAPSIVPNEGNIKVPYMQVGMFQQYYYWKFPVKNDLATKKGISLKLVTNMGSGRRNGMVMKIFGTTDTSLTNMNMNIPIPQSYVDIPEENPPDEL